MNEVDSFSAEDRDETLKIYQNPRLDTKGNMMEYGEFRIFRILPNNADPEEMFTKRFDVRESYQDGSIIAYFRTSKGEKKLYMIKV